jgi:putative DNA primase/helicase
MMPDGDDDPQASRKVIDFPISPEERARRLRAEVERLSRLPTVEWMLYIEGDAEKYAEKYDVNKATLKGMVEAVIKEAEKRQRDEQAERRRIEARAEKQAEKKVRQEKAKAKEECEEIERQDRRARRDTRDQLAAERRARQRQREIDRQLAIILKQPSAEHDSRLMEAATRLGEDINDLRAQFAELLDAERERRGIGDVEPWSEPVNVNTLLNDIHKHRGRYVIIHDDYGAVATTLWTAHSWIHNEIATHSPPLLITSADDEGNAAKTLLCKYLQYQTPRGKVVAELSGASFFHMIDRIHPTLIIDNAENLFRRKKDLIELLNNSWTRGIPVPRQVHGVTVEYDVFCPKVIGAIAGSNFLPPNSMGRSIHFGMLPKLPSETVEKFQYADNDKFLEQRRKLTRFALDNAEALRTANPAAPEGFDNRLQENWRLLFAIADLAGGSWPKRARAAAVKLTKQYYEPSVGRQCLSLFVELFLTSEYEGMVTSAWAQEQFVADPTSIWVNYKGRGPITQWGIKHILAAYHIRPDFIHPRGRPADRGYKIEWFEIAFRHYLGVEIADILEQRRKRRKK